MQNDPQSGAESELLVCVKCRHGTESPSDEGQSGRRLFDRLCALGAPAGVRLRAVACLQNCKRGCTVALRGDGRWTYVYGNLDHTSDAETLLDGAGRYHATADGLIPWRERPEHFKRNCVARVPPAFFADPLKESDT